MKKLVLTAVAVLSLLALAVPAFADSEAPAWYPAQVSFQSNYNGTLYQATGAPVNLNNATVFSTSLLDTSVALPISSAYAFQAFAARPPYSTINADTLNLFRVRLQADATGADTFKVVVQASLDGVTWASVDSANTWGLFAAGAANSAPDSGTVVVSSTVGFVYTAKVVNPAAVVAGQQYANGSRFQDIGKGYVRFLVRRDYSAYSSGKATTGKYSLSFALYTADPDWSHRQ